MILNLYSADILLYAVSTTTAAIFSDTALNTDLYSTGTSSTPHTLG